MRQNYTTFGVIGYYKNIVSSTYRNPHFPGIVHGCRKGMDMYVSLENKKSISVLDLACGSGEATVAVEAWMHQSGVSGEIEAADPYTHSAYLERTGKIAMSFSFQDIADGLIEHYFDVCILSFAAHLIKPSMLFITLYQLSQKCKYLLVLSPHKKPVIVEKYGWILVYECMADMRVRTRLYKSLNISS